MAPYRMIEAFSLSFRSSVTCVEFTAGISEVIFSRSGNDLLLLSHREPKLLISHYYDDRIPLQVKSTTFNNRMQLFLLKNHLLFSGVPFSEVGTRVSIAGYVCR